MNYRALIGLAALAACGLASVAQSEPSRVDPSMIVRAQYGPTVYHYCYIAKAPYGDTVYFSETFGVPQGTYSVGIQNAFNSVVTGRFDSSVISGASCMGPYQTASEAADELNNHMGDRRRAGKSVVMTWWRYSGD